MINHCLHLLYMDLYHVIFAIYCQPILYICHLPGSAKLLWQNGGLLPRTLISTRCDRTRLNTRDLLIRSRLGTQSPNHSRYQSQHVYVR